ncbi:MAG: hypothetical protein WCR27_09740 [Eubacteriales bacterium]
MTAENIEAVFNLHVHIIKYMDIPVIIPFLDEKVSGNIPIWQELFHPLPITTPEVKKQKSI